MSCLIHTLSSTGNPTQRQLRADLLEERSTGRGLDKLYRSPPNNITNGTKLKKIIIMKQNQNNECSIQSQQFTQVLRFVSIGGQQRKIGWFQFEISCPRVPLSIKSNGIRDNKLASLGKISWNNTAHLRKHAYFLCFVFFFLIFYFYHYYKDSMSTYSCGVERGVRARNKGQRRKKGGGKKGARF